MSFKTRIENNTASVTGFDLTNALKKGIAYVLSVISQNPAILKDFATRQQLSSSSNGIEYKEALKVLYLLNTSYHNASGTFTEARKVPIALQDKVADSSSIHYALLESPSYYIEGDRIYIYPFEANRKLMLEVVQDERAYSYNDTNEIIYNANGSASVQSGFPIQYNELVVLHASECILMEKLSEFTNKLPTDLDSDLTMFDKIADISAQISLDTSLPSFTAPTFRDASDALTKAQNLIDGTTMGGDTENESVQYWLADEDEDMVQATLSTASQELQRASAILGDYNAELSRSVSQFQQDVAKMGLELNEEQAKQQAKIAELQANLGKSIQLYNTLIQKIEVDFKYLTSQLQMVAGKKQEFIQLNISPKQLDVNPRQV